MAYFNFVISQNAKWGHAGFYIDCHRMTVPENILLQKKHWLQYFIDLNGRLKGHGSLGHTHDPLSALLVHYCRTLQLLFAVEKALDDECQSSFTGGGYQLGTMVPLGGAGLTLICVGDACLGGALLFDADPLLPADDDDC